jgi:ATP-dependent Clp protease ATP-binding subunit ClpB
VANFKNTIIIMTSNIGSHFIQEKYMEALKGAPDAWEKYFKDEAKEQVMELLKASVRPEFLNRIDEIVLFDPLGRNEIRKIVAIQFDAIKARLQEQGILIEATAAALDKLGAMKVKGRKIAALGDMFELGKTAATLHKTLVKKL